MELKRPTENPNKNLPINKFVNDKKQVMIFPTIPNEHAIKTALRLPTFINLPPLIAPIVIPTTTDVPISACFLVAKLSS